MAACPADFGVEGGTPISNMRTIMGEIDAALGVSGPPAIEYIFCDAYGKERETTWQWLYRNIANFGHALVRYTLPTGEQVVMSACMSVPALCVM